MSTAGPPSPASFAGSDWGNGLQGIPPPHKIGSPGGNNNNNNNFSGPPGGGRANLPTPPISGSSNGSMMNGGMMNGGPPPPGPYGGMGGLPPRTASRGPGGPPGQPSPPQSLGRLSTSSNLSIRDPEAARRRQMMMEDTLGQHYQVLRNYLASDLKRDAEGRSKKARDKLLRLSAIQFHELSTDIYDELRRRQNQYRAPPNAPNFLIPKENFHPKRNQARQKLSTLPETRFRDLATDVFFELERRFPRFTGRQGPNGMGSPSRTGTPMGYRGPHGRQDSLASAIMSPDGYSQKGPTGNTLVPNKSYLVEDDDDAEFDSLYGGANKRDTTATARSLGSDKIIGEYQTKIEDLEGKVTALEAQLKEKDEEMETRRASNGAANEEAEGLRRALEDKLNSAQALNRSLQDEIDSARQEQDRTQDQLDDFRRQNIEAQSLRSQHDDLLTDHSDLRDAHDDLKRQHESLQRQLKESSGGGEWRVRCEDLEHENQNLRKSVQDQQQVTRDVKAEAAGFLADMKSMIVQTDQGSRREEQLSQRNQQLQAEVQEWKDRYSKSKAQLSTSRRASLGLAQQQPEFSKNLRAPNGLIRDIDITNFQLGVDETLKTARQGEPAAVLDKVKDVVSAVRPMVRSGASLTEPKAIKARNKLTATVNNFITAGHNFVQSGGISPVSLLDAAASHLSSALVEFATIVKIGPSDGNGNVTTSTRGYDSDRAAPSKPQVQPLNLQPHSYQQNRYGNHDEHDDDDDDDDPTAGYYADTPVTATPIDHQQHSAVAEPPAVETIAEPAGELLPSTTYQLPSTTYQPQGLQPRKPVGSVGQVLPQANGDGGEHDLTELKHFLDDQTSLLITSIQSLVTSIRGAAPASEVYSRLNTIVTTSGAILQRSAGTVEVSGNEQLRSQAAPVIAQLEQSLANMQAKESEGHNVAEGTPDWKKWCQGVPPIAFAIAKVVKELGSKVRGVASEDDFS